MFFFSGTSACAEQTAHPSSNTNSSRPKTLHPIEFDRVPPYHEYLCKSAHPVFRWSLCSSQGKSQRLIRNTLITLKYSRWERRNCIFTGMRFRKIFSNSSTIFWYSEFLWCPRKFTLADFNASQAESCIGFNVSSKLASFIISVLSGPSNIPVLSFFML